MVNKSPAIESLRDALLWSTLCWSLVSLHQLLVKQWVENALNSWMAQFIGTLWNSFINLRIYDFSKIILYKAWLNKRQAEIWWWIVSWAESFIINYLISEISSAKDPFIIAMFFSILTALFLPTVYEKKFVWKKITKKVIRI